jgi:hypothetical protein
MTPKDKAIELVDKYSKFDFSTLSVIKQRQYAKQCALIAVDEIISYSSEWDDSNYWEQVIAEIEAL